MAHDDQGSIYLIENSVKNIINIVKHLLQFKISVFYFNVFENVVCSCDSKVNFQQHYSSLQCHMILKNN